MRARWLARSSNSSQALPSAPSAIGDEDELVSLNTDAGDGDDLRSVCGSDWGLIDGDMAETIHGHDSVVPLPIDKSAIMEAKPKYAPKPSVVVVDAVATEVDTEVATAKKPVFDPKTLALDKFRCTDKQQFKYPWERGSLKRIFGSSDLINKKRLAVQPSDHNPIKVSLEVGMQATVSASIDYVAVESSTALFSKVVKSMEQLDYKKERAKKRAKAVRDWWELISVDLSASAIGRKVLEEATVDDHYAYGLEVVDACFGLKSPQTLQRLYALKSFSDWCTAAFDRVWLPLTEGNAWQYIRRLKLIEAPATKATTFLEAARFGWFIVGLDGGDEVQASLRARGLSSQLFSSKKPWKPADLLSTEEVLRIHQFLDNVHNNPIDRVMAGHLLHMLYVRARWSDLLSVKNAMVDAEETFFEMETRTHKGAKGAGINGKNWVASYLSVRSEAGLELPDVEETHMLPAPSSGGTNLWTARHLTSEEGANFLRDLLRVPRSGDRRISTHSMKSTAISWTSKFGLNFEARALLARHASSVSNPTAMYSRDLLSPVMRSFIGVIEQIHDGQFAPDKTRSGMITPRVPGGTAPSTPFVQASPAPLVPKVEVVISDEEPMLESPSKVGPMSEASAALEKPLL